MEGEVKSASRTIHPFALGLQAAPKATRTDPPQFSQWQHVRGFVIQDFLSLQECNTLITTARGVAQQAGKTGEGFDRLDGEYPPAYRSNSRLLMRSSGYAGALYRRLLPHFKRRDIEGIRPYGFENSGVWKPAKINDVIKVSHYKANTEFKPHMDGSVTEDDQTRSIFTLLIYLNEAYKGGETEFYSGDEKFKVKPKTGLAILFNHDLSHAGLPVTWGGKYILKTEVMFRSFSAPDPEIQNDPLFKEVDDLYTKSAQLEKSGDAQAATDAYLKAIQIQTKSRSVPTEVVVAKSDDATAEVPLTLMLSFIQGLSYKELVDLQTVSKRWRKIAQHELLWHPLFLSQFPSQCQAAGAIISNAQDAYLLDWYQFFKTSFEAGRSKVVTLDLGSFTVKYKIAGSPPQQNANMYGRPQIETWSGHGQSPFRTLMDIYVYCEDTYQYAEVYSPVKEGKVREWAHEAKIIKWIFRKKLKLNLETTPVVIAEENTASDEDHKTLVQTAFEVLNIPWVCIVPAAVLALLAAGKESALVVDCSPERSTLTPVRNLTVQRKEVTVWKQGGKQSLGAAIHQKLNELKDDKSGLAKQVVFCGWSATAEVQEEVKIELQSLFKNQPLPTISLAVPEPVYGVVEGGDFAAILTQTTKRFKFMNRTDYFTTLNAVRLESEDTKRELEMVRKLRAAMLGN